MVGARLSRRQALLGMVGATAVAAGTGVWSRVSQAAMGTLKFAELEKVYDQTHHVAPGYDANILIRWGDPLAEGVEFDPAAISADSQSKQFGYNCDFIGYMPLPVGSNNSEHGLLCVNNEYPDPHIMWSGLTEDDAATKASEDQIKAMMAAWGHTVVEIKKENGKWSYVQDSEYNRRINGYTEMTVSGPAAGHVLLKTSADPSGIKVIGTGYNCAGGTTPWGTILTCEEGLSDTFGGDAAKAANPELLDRYGYDGSDYYGFARVTERLHLDKEPNEPNRFDWVVEIDPYEPNAAPVKRTALGRFGHEGATTVVNKDGRVVVYLGDDDYFEYIYRFVTKGTFNPNDRAANKNLLDEGELSVAKFDADGTLTWLPLVHGQNGLTAENGFADQGELLVKTRLAADLLGATPMDRPEDVEASPVNGRVYAVMTKNAKRKPEQVDAANSRAENKYGHILEMSPPGEGKDADHAAANFKWDVFLLAGNPAKPEEGSAYNPGTTVNGWFAAPDNIAFDPRGRMWIATDGAPDFGIADGLYATETDGAGRALTRMFFACPTGSEVCGPCFTPDGKTLFVAVQHPAEDSETLDNPTTRWPDFADNLPPRPSVVAITQKEGLEIGA
jgi:secreted PhoX family phosphatase